jgi:hypothetical protein
LGDARAGIGACGKALAKVEAEDISFWCAPETADAMPRKAGAWLLPAYDEYMVAYKDRSASLADKHFSNAITGNGIFSPIIVIDGAVKGVWKREIKKGKALITATWFDEPKKKEIAGVVQAAKTYGVFMGCAMEVR